MEYPVLLSNILKDIIKDVEDENTRRDFIIEHIRNVTVNNVFELQLPLGKDWFNVTRPLNENDLRGKVVVLDFFTYCCINCLHLIPHLRALEENFSVADGLIVIGVHSAKFENEKSSSNIALALKRYNITHPVVNDSDGFIWNHMSISCWPTVVILGPGGQILFILVGEQCRNELFLYVESALKFYKNDISSHLLPVSGCSNIVTSSILNFPGKIARYENLVAISDSGNHRILVIDQGGYIKFKIGGKSSGFQDGTLHEAKFNSPQGIAFYNKDEIYVADMENHAIRLINLREGNVKTIVGTGAQGTDFVGGKTGVLQEISSPWDLCFVPSTHIKEHFSNILPLHPPENIKGSGSLLNAPPPPPPPPPGSTSTIPKPPKLPSSPNVNDSVKTNQNLTSSKVLLIAMSGIHQIWALFLEDTVWWRGKKYEANVCVAIAGNGKEENRNNNYPMTASFAQPSGLSYSASQKCVFIADSESSSIRKMSLEDGSVVHVVGGDKNPIDLFNFGDIDGKGYAAKLQHPLGLTCSKDGNTVYLCDTYNNKIKQVNLSNSECFSLNKENKLFNEPSGCVLDETGEVLLIADTNNNRIAAFNLNKKITENITIKEMKSEEHHTSENTWEVETEVSSKGGSLTLVLHLGPEDLHGSWKLEIGDSKLECDQIKGQISSKPHVILLKILPNESHRTDMANIFFNLSFCERDVCLFKKFLLKLRIMRSQTGKEATKVEFRKIIN